MPPARKSGYPTSIRIPEEVRKVLDAEAKRREWPLMQLVADILRQWCERRK